MGHAVILAGESPYKQIVIGDRAFIHQTDVFAGVIFPVQIGTFPVVPNIAIMCPLGPGAGLPLGKPGRPPAEPQPVKAEAKSTNSSKQFTNRLFHKVFLDHCGHPLKYIYRLSVCHTICQHRQTPDHCLYLQIEGGRRGTAAAICDQGRHIS